jgi:hypothetical protein
MTNTETQEPTRTAGRTASGWSPPYTSFTTLINTLARMKEEGGPPSRLDGSYLSNYAGGTRYTFIASLKALGLIDDDAKPTKTLADLVAADEKTQKLIIAELVMEHYTDAVALPPNATQAELEKVFRDYGIGGSTVRKAIGFYLAAARFADIPISRHFKLPKLQAGERKTTAKKTEVHQPEQKQQEPPLRHQQRSGLDDLHPFIVGLIRELPKAGEPFPDDKQKAWFEIASATFRLIYNTDSPDVATVRLNVTPSGTEG